MSEPAAEPTIGEAALAAAGSPGVPPTEWENTPAVSEYVTRDELAAWITDEMGPKMQTLAQRLDELEAAVKQFRADLDQRIADSQKVAAEWADTFNRAEELRGQREEDVKAQLELLQQLDEKTGQRIGELDAKIEQASADLGSRIDTIQRKLPSSEGSA